VLVPYLTYFRTVHGLGNSETMKLDGPFRSDELQNLKRESLQARLKVQSCVVNLRERFICLPAQILDTADEQPATSHRICCKPYSSNRRPRIRTSRRAKSCACPKGGDELNLIQPGKNYGWPLVSYATNYSGVPIPSPDTRTDLTKPIIYWTPILATPRHAVVC
jgi:hypothetical protein